jgi:phage recombination protein Bet
MSTDIVKQESTELTEQRVMDLLFGDARVKPTKGEVGFFIEMCKARSLNPFLREIYLIKYDENRPASYVVGKDAFTQRANSIPEYDGMGAGIIVQRGNKIEYLDGTFHAPGDVLLGGWAKAYRKDRSHPSSASVSIQEYSSSQSTWKQMPATMIRKVAVVQALREAFPNEVGGLYDASEMQQAKDLKEIDLLKETGVDVVPEHITIATEVATPTPSTTQPASATPVDGDFFCPEHKTEWFMKGRMKGYAHPFGEGLWCNMDAWVKAHPSTEPEEEPLSIFEVEPEEEEEGQGIGI